MITEQSICRRLKIKDQRFVEIESKHRVLPSQMSEIKNYLIKKKKAKHKKSATFFDQYLDTPNMDIFKKGASLRVRYKKNGTRVYVQYKGPGFHLQRLLYRSEFVTQALNDVVLEESQHDVVEFNIKSLRDILMGQIPPIMKLAMQEHLGSKIIDKISIAPLICTYQKEKFEVAQGSSFLEPSLDHMSVFFVQKDKIHPLSTFCEYENEIKSKTESLSDKLQKVQKIIEFDKKLVETFNLAFEPQDKYHRSLSYFVGNHK